MTRYLFILFLSVLGYSSLAAEPDTLRAVHKDGTWAIKYVVKSGETVRMLALRFSLSEGQILNANDVATIKNFGPGNELTIPVPKDNFYTVRQPLSNQKELYYKVGQRDDISVIATYSGVTKAQIREWNSMKGNSLVPDQMLLVGWVKMIPKDTGNPVTLTAYPSKRKKVVADTFKMPVPGGLDTTYNRQTNNGINALTEKGTAVFFDKPGKSNIYIAFHNTARRGTIIKVTNPGNGRAIYARVLSRIPDNKQYANSIIGISNDAKDALGVMESKAWCELSYSTD